MGVLRVVLPLRRGPVSNTAGKPRLAALATVMSRLGVSLLMVDKSKVQPWKWQTRRAGAASPRERSDRALMRALFQRISLGLLPRLRICPCENSSKVKQAGGEQKQGTCASRGSEIYHPMIPSRRVPTPC